jgi:hypothetical protein
MSRRDFEMEVAMYEHIRIASFRGKTGKTFGAGPPLDQAV